MRRKRGPHSTTTIVGNFRSKYIKQTVVIPRVSDVPSRNTADYNLPRKCGRKASCGDKLDPGPRVFCHRVASHRYPTLETAFSFYASFPTDGCLSPMKICIFNISERKTSGTKKLSKKRRAVRRKMSCPVGRKYPLRQPKNYRPPVPRWSLKLPADVDRVFTIYVGIQKHASDTATESAATKAKQSIVAWIGDAHPEAYENFTVLEGDDEVGSEVWVCYFADVAAYDDSARKLSLSQIHASLVTDAAKIGLWCERFSTAVSRLETNYSGLDYLPGLARISGAETAEHTYSAYWGAARDRIPDSGQDLFAKASDQETAPPQAVPSSIGQHLIGTNYENMVHIRSGQFWENCGLEEAESYETKLEPALLTGLRYLWENPLYTGTIGLRFVRNEGLPGQTARETCGTGFFRSLGDLEAWAEKHPSHKAIYLGAIKHAKTFGAERKMRTWHEVSILRAGEARFEYVNCTPKTGVIRFVHLDEKEE